MLTLIMGGVFFLIPLLAIIVLATRGFRLVAPLANTLVDVLNIHTLFGATSVTIISVLILLSICLVSGVLLSKGFFTRWNGAIEEKLFLLFPTFQMLKYQFMDDGEGFINQQWSAILLKEDNHFRIGFVTDQSSEVFMSVFVPDAPRIDAGEVRYIHRELTEWHPITMKQAMGALHHFGKDQEINKALKGIWES